jgi:hypothetical protein
MRRGRASRARVVPGLKMLPARLAIVAALLAAERVLADEARPSVDPLVATT